jgi:2-(1,2-epoxy-1,2-dihydrophenyl)acetyl-CoA isomerase
VTTPSVRYEIDGHVATITLDRAETMNSLTRETKDVLRDALLAAGDDDTVRCLVVTGTGRAFCVGQDLREHVDNLGSVPMAEVWATVPKHYAPIATALATMPKPVVAAVNGVAAGAGASMAFACDFRLVAESAGFNTAFTGIGLSCDTGASWTLPRLVGHAKAVELLMTPRTVKADEAASLGLATRVVPDDQLGEAAAELARTLAAGPTLAYAAIKQAVAYAAAADLPAALELEAQLMAITGASQDHRDAVAAFVAKQPPAFHGR